MSTITAQRKLSVALNGVEYDCTFWHTSVKYAKVDDFTEIEFTSVSVNGKELIQMLSSITLRQLEYKLLADLESEHGE